MDANSLNQQSQQSFSYGDEDFLHYLGRKVSNAQLPTDGVVQELDLYTMKKHPWEMFGASQVKGSKFYFYNKLRTMGTNEGSKKKRKKIPNAPRTRTRYLRRNRCGGRWKGQKSIDIKDGHGRLIGERRKFSYLAGLGEDDMNRWVMHEYCVDVEGGLYEGCGLPKFKNYVLYCLINYTSVPEEESTGSKEANPLTPTSLQSEIRYPILTMPLDQTERNQVSVYPEQLYGNATNVNTCLSIESVQPESNYDGFLAFHRDDISKVPDATVDILMSEPVEPIYNNQAYHRQSYMQELSRVMDTFVSQPHPTITNQAQAEFMLSQPSLTIPEQAQPESFSSPDVINTGDFGDFLADVEVNMEHRDELLEPIYNNQAYHSRSDMQEHSRVMDTFVSQPHPTITNQAQAEVMLSQPSPTIPEQALAEKLPSLDDMNNADIISFLDEILDYSKTDMEHSDGLPEPICNNLAYHSQSDMQEHIVAMDDEDSNLQEVEIIEDQCVEMVQENESELSITRENRENMFRCREEAELGNQIWEDFLEDKAIFKSMFPEHCYLEDSYSETSLIF